jgi:Bacterial Ig-like domain (group 1)
VVVTIHDGADNPVPGATVSIGWSAGGTPTATGTTDANGRCTFISGAISKSIPTVTLTITGVTYPGLTYSPGDNHDPDGESNGTSITLLKP